MPEPIATVGIGVIAAYVGKDAVVRILGPTADYLGGELKEFTVKRVENVGAIFSNAKKKLGEKLNSPGQVPPKVLRTIINEGSFSDDDIAVEYFGGVLASSRTEIGRDDRGARMAKMIDNMSVYQLRTHYLIYSTISELFSRNGNRFNTFEDRRKMPIFLSFGRYVEAMGFTQNELNNPQILDHIFHGLSSDGLLEDRWGYGNQELLKQFHPRIPGDGIVCTPSALGVELLLWAFGHGDRELNFVLTRDFSPDIEGLSKSISDAVAIMEIADESN